jgi:glycosyltransferase involved in cell wall biosynthesis
VAGVDKWQELAAAEVLFLPSFQENFGLVVAEAMACGRPALLSTHVDIWNWVVEGGAGFADESTLAGVRRLLNRWEAQSSSERDAMSAAALSVYNQRFSPTNMAACMRSLYDEIAST